MRHGAPRQASTGTARHHRHVQCMTRAQNRLHLFVGFGQCHAQRALAVSGQTIAFIRRGVFRRRQDRVRGQHPAQCRNHLRAALSQSHVLRSQAVHFRGGQCIHTATLNRMPVGAHKQQPCPFFRPLEAVKQEVCIARVCKMRWRTGSVKKLTASQYR